VRFPIRKSGQLRRARTPRGGHVTLAWKDEMMQAIDLIFQVG
jgi:hypothetical protein